MGVLLQGWRELRQTTLKTAWSWAFAAASAWTMTWFVDHCANAVSSAFADHAWYSCAVLALCPPVAVLGSRRPGTRVWMWFILVPMLMALGWPLVAVRLQGSEFRGVQLELPQLCAFAFVLVMGVGNYLGTRFTLSALLYGGAVLLSVISMSSIAPPWLSDRPQVRLWCSGVVAIAIVSIKFNRRPLMQTGFDRLWIDFFDTFGIVWGRRIQDRINHLAEKESWPCRLELHGFVDVNPLAMNGSRQSELVQTQPVPWRAGDQWPGKDASQTRIEHAFRWLLRRFVDPRWIDRRIGPNASSNELKEGIDS